jgi:glycosyltransferase involved in cell wall biosynthesis
MLEEICVAEHADLFVSTYYTQPTFCRSLLLLHDMTPEVLGDDLTDGQWREKHRAIRHASAYVSVSRNTAHDFRGFFPSEATKPMRIMVLAPDPVFAPAPAGEITSLLHTLNLPTRYYVFVGDRRGYKNAQLAFRALESGMAPTDLGLLCVGGRSTLEPELAELAEGHEVRVASLSDKQLRAAYSGSAALLYPSTYEGFGLPILEAMACGCPVITCDNSSQREVAADAALYVDDKDPRELSAAMLHALRNDVRRDLARRGVERSGLFSWKRSAADLASAIQLCADRPRLGAT